MKITLTATLTDEEIEILASAKWYEKIIIEYEEIETPYEAHTIWEIKYPAWVSISKNTVEKENPQTASDYIRQVYEGIIIADATKVFTEYRTKQIKEQIILTEQEVRDWVTSSITSTVE